MTRRLPRLPTKAREVATRQLDDSISRATVRIEAGSNPNLLCSAFKGADAPKAVHADHAALRPDEMQSRICAGWIPFTVEKRQIDRQRRRREAKQRG